MKIIDLEIKGNLVRFYLGQDDCDDYCGGKWDEKSYEHYADLVYDRYIAGMCDVVFPFDAIVLEPCCGHVDSRWRKDDMKARRVPCLVVMMPDVFDEDEYTWIYDNDFDRCVADERSIKIRFGDHMDPSNRIVESGA